MHKCSFVFMNTIREYLCSSHKNHNYFVELRVYNGWTSSCGSRMSDLKRHIKDLFFGRLYKQLILCGVNCVQ